MKCKRRDYCPDCRVKVGQLHLKGCTGERCPFCGFQAHTCDCPFEAWAPRFRALRMAWSGYWPGVTECWKYGFWCSYAPGRWGGWVQCGEGELGAREDLNRLLAVCDWDRDTRHWILPAEKVVVKKVDPLIRLTAGTVLLILRAYGSLKVGELLALFPNSKKYRTESRLRAILESLQERRQIQICRDVAVDSDNDMDLVVQLV